MKYTCLARWSLVIAIALLTSACTGGTASTGAPVTPAAMAGATATTEAAGATASPAALPSTPTELPVAATSPPPTEPASTDTPATPTIAPPASSTGTPDEGVDQIVGTVVRFSARSTSVDVTIGEDNPAVRDFLSMLPLTLTLEEFAGREKIAYPRASSHTPGRPGPIPKMVISSTTSRGATLASTTTPPESTIRTRRSISEPTTRPSNSSNSSKARTSSSRSSADADSTHASEYRVA